MPPKQSASTPAARGRSAGTNTKATATSRASADKPKSASSKTAKGKAKQREEPDANDSPGEDAMDVGEDEAEEAAVDDDDDDDDEPAKTIPPDLLSRILHEFFEKDGTRITKPANNAVAKYMDVFVKEAIARAAAERGGAFLEVCLLRGRLLCAVR